MQGVVTTDHLVEVADKEDLEGIEESFKYVLDYSEFRNAVDMGIVFNANDLDHGQYVRFKVIHSEVRASRKDGK